MKKLSIIIFLFLIISSCKKEFAHFQKSNYSTNDYSIKPIISQPELLVSNEMESISSRNFTKETVIENPQIPFIKEEINKNRVKNVKYRSKVLIVKPSFDSKKYSQNSTFKSLKAKPVPLNSAIYTGFIFLAIAISLSLLSLQTLSILFGIASIFMLYIGFKRYFRRRKWREIFR
ncbi:hypothetical protein Emtol_3432 [Emticicia oligotrophica DSM 17448]|uniref:Lipoprotein n=1 Tax=Emticicia oligotrophica (strain DSM 17448 / CIP 109782 / MTCC 6937 / GPTSA100-15) TaxID=929562 RepID=A0ABM5N4Y0_EMTOG|nr:hypothetical protein [Emticicia oligotrophica]AFK04561.1 hypothetical protein Emtol_3432 [Emticicia oligotrophica DSM 17448]